METLAPDGRGYQLETGKNFSRIWSVILFLGVTLGVGAVGSLITSGSADSWYPVLRKPFWTPPPWVFAPVWTILYIAMAVAAWRVWAGIKKKRTATPLVLYFSQLVLNLLWSVLFFGFRAPLAASIEIVVLFAAIILTILSFIKIDAIAAWLLVPYVLWVAFAGALNMAIVLMNR